MMNTQAVKKLLDASPVKRHYDLRVGQRVSIAFPSIPMNRFTEYVSLVPSKAGDLGTVVEKPVAVRSSSEGMSVEQGVAVQALKPGQMSYVVRAVDTLTGHELPDVNPFEIEIIVHR